MEIELSLVDKGLFRGELRMILQRERERFKLPVYYISQRILTLLLYAESSSRRSLCSNWETSRSSCPCTIADEVEWAGRDER